MSEIKVPKDGASELLKKFSKNIVKACSITAIVGVLLLVLWFVLSKVLENFPEYLQLFSVLAVAIVLFTFATRITEGTIYKYVFAIGQSFFLIIYLIYATEGGTLAINIMDLHFSIEFVPLLALMIVINILAIAKGILQAIEFMSESPKD